MNIFPQPAASKRCVSLQLRGFKRLAPIAAGASTKVMLELDVARDLWLVDLEYKKVVEPGAFQVMVGGSSAKIQQTVTLTVTG